MAFLFMASRTLHRGKSLDDAALFRFPPSRWLPCSLLSHSSSASFACLVPTSRVCYGNSRGAGAGAQDQSNNLAPVGSRSEPRVLHLRRLGPKPELVFGVVPRRRAAKQQQDATVTGVVAPDRSSCTCRRAYGRPLPLTRLVACRPFCHITFFPSVSLAGLTARVTQRLCFFQVRVVAELDNRADEPTSVVQRRTHLAVVGSRGPDNGVRLSNARLAPKVAGRQGRKSAGCDHPTR